MPKRLIPVLHRWLKLSICLQLASLEISVDSVAFSSTHEKLNEQQKDVCSNQRQENEPLERGATCDTGILETNAPDVNCFKSNICWSVWLVNILRSKRCTYMLVGSNKSR